MRLPFLIIIGLCFSFVSVAQQSLGISSSNYSGTNALHFNPASVVDSRYKLYLNLIGDDISAISNYIQFKRPLNEFQNLAGSETQNGRDKNLFITNDVRGPSLLYSINQKNAIALTSKLSLGFSATDMTEVTAQLFRYGVTKDFNFEKINPNQKLAVNTNGQIEFGLTYGREIVNDEDWYLKGGLSVKRIIGLYSLHFLGNNITTSFIKDQNAYQETRINIENLDLDYGFTKGKSFENFRFKPEWLFGNAPAGTGWGFDIGFVYEFRPNFYQYNYTDKGKTKFDPSVNKYKIRVSAAITDIGKVNYNNPFYVQQYQAEGINNAIFYEERFARIRNADEISTLVDETVRIKNGVGGNSFEVNLPTTLNVSVDYLLKDNIYLTAIASKKLYKTYQIGLQRPDVFAIMARYETKWLEVSLPISFINYRTLTLGVSARYGPIFVGTDYLSGLLNIGSPRGVNAFLGLSVPIFQSKPSGANCPVIKGRPTKYKMRDFFQKVRDRVF